jgi:NADH dehydrogenase/NADH:ubiquinone oxidoreductase subunit G
MMGVCFDCLVEIDEQPNQQACMINVYQEMKIKRQENLLK